ncbi:hypothetical protein UFOVP257_88 [uncultured Caudovirales phage]|uniref:Uncharacterized protein n=1 Tax=uncultured Caudovirales phage TaxID=2100421 RepID=A0A6J5LGB1_9CAUD|nr:hypothetical protein UFOVP257_88 [uncultured Caudovirales phage]
MRIIKSEWHQVEKRYAMDLQRIDLDTIYPHSSEEENDELWQQIIDGEFEDFEELCYDGELQEHYLEFDWLDEDDWWTDRKGGYEVTYTVEADYEPPKTEKDFIRELRNEVNELLVRLGEEEKYDTRPDDVRLAELQALFEQELEFEEEQVECFSCGALHLESELPEMSGQYICPSCGEGWVMKDQREESDE